MGASLSKVGEMKAMGQRLNVLRTEYLNGRTAIELYMPDGERFATLSVNLPNEPNPPAGCFWAKTWSENAPLRSPALRSGLFEDTGRRVQTGFVLAELWRLV